MADEQPTLPRPDTPLLIALKLCAEGEGTEQQRISGSCQRPLLFVDVDHVCPRKRAFAKRANREPSHCSSPFLCVFMTQSHCGILDAPARTDARQLPS